MRKKKKKDASANTKSSSPAAKSTLIQNIAKSVLELTKGKHYKPLNKENLFQRLHLPLFHQTVFEEALADLVQSGLMMQNSQGDYHIAEKKHKIIRGALSMTSRGFGFVVPNPDENYPADVFIPRHLIKNGTHGDIVEVLVTSETGLNNKGPEGKILSIIKHSNTCIIGVLIEIDASDPGLGQAHVSALSAKKQVAVKIEKEMQPLAVGDRVVLHVTSWGDQENEAMECTVVRCLGNISDASRDNAAAIEEFHLRSEFPSDVLQEVAKMSMRVSTKEMQGRLDLRERETFTIDPDTARDYDDALSLHKDAKGHYHLAVHIADVSHYVQPGSAIDLEAQLRCNSTYLPGHCIPMLPHALSNNLCSLKENVNRLCVSVLVEIDAEGAVVSHEIARSVIHSDRRFTYKEAKEVIDGKRRSKHASTLHLMVELCHLLKKQRSLRGSIEFAMPDIMLHIDSDGMPTSVEKIEYDITHQLVEEFMLKANEIVAMHLSKKGVQIPYRIHSEPSEDNMSEFSAMAALFGFKLQSPPTTEELQQLFKESAEYYYGQQLSVAFIKSMKLASYSSENIGHYGLSLEYYTHFTSPIRRYVDLIVHRALFQPDYYSCGDIDAICAASSEQERVSMRAENSVLTLKKLRYIQKQQQEKEMGYKALILRIKPFGITFELLDLMLGGFLHISQIGNDYFVFDEKSASLYGRRSGTSFCAGDAIEVIASDINFITLECKWEVQETSPKQQEEERRPQRQEKRKRECEREKPAKKRRKNLESPAS